MAQILLQRGSANNLDKLSITDGQLIFTTDTNEIYSDIGQNRVKFSDVIQVANEDALPEIGLEGKLYIVDDINAVAIWNGESYTQLNVDEGATGVKIEGEGNVITGASYNEATREMVYTMGTVDLEAVKNDVYQLTSDSTDIDTLTADITPKAGDVLIITSTTNNIKSAYSYDAEDGWVACDGNVAAEKVILKDNITLAGDYTAVGNLTKTKTGTATFETAGKSVAYALGEILSKRQKPTVTANPLYLLLSLKQKHMKLVLL